MQPTQPRPRSRQLVRALFVATLAGAPIATAQDPGGPPAPEPGSREAMWPAPTAEDWARPCLIRWQRTWNDAVAVSSETNKAILVCVNMDGEIASEHYAGIRYRQPDIAKLYEPYVTVIASVYRHNPRDHDEQGHRIPCPRFGTVTCGEHIAIEPLLYEKFLDGTRVAPRHIMVELDGAETYDIYYAFDTDSVFGAIRDGIANRQVEPKEIARGDRPLLDRVRSRDISDREAVETAFQQGDAATRRALMEAAAAAGDAASVDLLRLGIFGLDDQNASLARQALAKASSIGAVDLLNDALGAPMAEPQRQGLIDALARIGTNSAKARTLAVVHRGLGVTASAVDVTDWQTSLAGAEYPAPTDWGALENRLEQRAAATGSQPRDPQAALELAVAAVEFAIDPETARVLAADPRTASQFTRLNFEDARRAAERAQELGASGWQLQAAMAVTAKHLGRLEEAYRHAAAAAPELPSGATDRVAAEVLELFAHGRQKAITKAVVNKEKWPPQWLTDVDASYSVLAQHPLGTPQHVVDHYDFLHWLDAKGQAGRALEQGLARFPDAWELHGRARKKIVRERGVGGLEAGYAAFLERLDGLAHPQWYTGYTALVAAEYHRRRGNAEAAVAAYDRAIALYEECLTSAPALQDGVDHYVAMALGGRARANLERGDDDTATNDVLAAFARQANAAATLDGLNVTAVGTARMLQTRLLEQGREALAAKIDQALADLGTLDPALLELPAFERGGPPLPQRGRGRRNRRGG
ncbi:MAG: hypothetical protein AAF628_01235 [Planctomycetota bacterium]